MPIHSQSEGFWAKRMRELGCWLHKPIHWRGPAFYDNDPWPKFGVYYERSGYYYHYWLVAGGWWWYCEDWCAAMTSGLAQRAQGAGKKKYQVASQNWRDLCGNECVLIYLVSQSSTHFIYRLSLLGALCRNDKRVCDQTKALPLLNDCWLEIWLAVGTFGRIGWEFNNSDSGQSHSEIDAIREVKSYLGRVWVLSDRK